MKVIHVSQGKRTRAEPVAALYEPRHIGGDVLPGRVRHLGECEGAAAIGTAEQGQEFIGHSISLQDVWGK